MSTLRGLASWIFLATALGAQCLAQVTFNSENGPFGRPSSPTPASPGWPSGPPGSHVSMEGLLVRSDGETLSIELPDQRVIRFRLDERTRYKPDGPLERLTAFHVTDVVAVESEVDTKGYFVARFVRFARKSSPQEKTEILQSPEFRQQWSKNLLSSDGMDLPSEERKLILVPKPNAISDREEDKAPGLRPARWQSEPAEDDLIPLVRRAVNDAFDRLPNFRAKQVTSLFHSASKVIKWVPDNVVAAEIGYDEERESYSDIRIDGKRPGDAPLTADADYMHSLGKAWSTGDFKTLSHCVFSELEDSDFRKVRTEHGEVGDLVVYEFSHGSPSTCISVLFRSQVVYPGYKGLLKVRTQTREATHVELEAADMPPAFPLDRAERSADFGTVGIGGEQYLLPTTAYWFGCFRNSYSCFLNRMDFRDYRRFEAKSTVRFADH